MLFERVVLQTKTFVWYDTVRSIHLATIRLASFKKYTVYFRRSIFRHTIQLIPLISLTTNFILRVVPKEVPVVSVLMFYSPVGPLSPYDKVLHQTISESLMCHRLIIVPTLCSFVQ